MSHGRGTPGLLYVPLSGDERTQHKSRLTFQSSQDPEVIVRLYDESREGDGMLGLPKAYGLSRFGDTLGTVDGYTDGCSLRPNVAGRLKIADGFKWRSKTDQKQVADKFQRELLKSPWGGVLEAPPGTGKTVIAVHTIAQMQIPTLVVVHREHLVKQWYDRITEFTDLDVGDLGVAVQNNLRYGPRFPITVAMLHSLAARQGYEEEFRRNFGMVIYDEVHTVPTSHFSQVMGMFNARYQVGLSATPFRRDGMSRVFEAQLGPVIAKTEARDLVPKVIAISNPVWRGDRYFRRGNGDLVLGPMISHVVSIHDRNRRIVDAVGKAILKGRRLMILSDRVEHLKRLKEATLATGFVTSSAVSLLTGSTPKKDRARMLERPVIFATYQLLEAGTDIPELDTLVMASPRSRIEQPVGRILRPFPIPVHLVL